MVNVIFFKILVLSYKTLNGLDLAPKDLSNLITSYVMVMIMMMMIIFIIIIMVSSSFPVLIHCIAGSKLWAKGIQEKKLFQQQYFP